MTLKLSCRQEDWRLMWKKTGNYLKTQRLHSGQGLIRVSESVVATSMSKKFACLRMTSFLNAKKFIL